MDIFARRDYAGLRYGGNLCRLLHICPTLSPQLALP
jgi:hypothetical protein